MASHSTRFLRTLFVGSLVTSSLAGCSVPADLPNLLASREAGIRGSRICVINNTSMDMRVKWFETEGVRPILPGGQVCHSGYNAGGYAPEDVFGWIDYAPKPLPESGKWNQIITNATNSWLGGPHAEAIFASGDNWYGYCGFPDEGEEHSFEDGWVHVSFQRIADSPDNKEFVLIISPQTGNDRRQYCGNSHDYGPRDDQV